MARCQTHSESVNPVYDVCSAATYVRAGKLQGTARHDSQGMRWQVKPYEECEVKKLGKEVKCALPSKGLRENLPSESLAAGCILSRHG